MLQVMWQVLTNQSAIFVYAIDQSVSGRFIKYPRQINPQKLPNNFKLLPKWRNFAKSAYTRIYELQSLAMTIIFLKKLFVKHGSLYLRPNSFKLKSSIPCPYSLLEALTE